MWYGWIFIQADHYGRTDRYLTEESGTGERNIRKTTRIRETEKGAFQELKEEAEEKYGLRILTAWTFAKDERLKYQNDHAGANETSIVMAVRPELVDFGQVKDDESNLIGIAGRHPVKESSEAFGNEILEYTMETLIAGTEEEYKKIKER